MLNSGILVGTVLHDTYEITRLIEEGGMGMVFEAKSVRLAKKRFAIKVLRGSVVSEDPEAYARFRQEAEIISSLGHPNIVDVIDFNITDDGSPYMVMELLTGEDLGSRLDRDKMLQPEVAGQVFLQIGAALQAAHDEGVVHRDLKPKNVFLVNEPGNPNKVKLLDFGISKLRNSSRVLTKHHSAVGTPLYMSPEQTEGGEIDHTTDVFSMATTAYLCLTGVHPFEGPTEYKIMTKVCQEDPAPACKLRPELPAEVHDILRQAHHKSRELRYARAEDFGVELAEALGVPWARTGRISGVMDAVGDSGSKPPPEQRQTPESGRMTRVETPTPFMVEQRPTDASGDISEPDAGPAEEEQNSADIIPTALKPTPPPQETMILRQEDDPVEDAPAAEPEPEPSPEPEPVEAQEELAGQATQILQRNEENKERAPTEMESTPPPTMILPVEDAVVDSQEALAPVTEPEPEPEPEPAPGPPADASRSAPVSAPTTPPGSDTDQVPVAPTPPKSRLALFLGGGGALLVVGLLGGYLLSTGGAAVRPPKAAVPRPTPKAAAPPALPADLAAAMAPSSPDAAARPDARQSNLARAAEPPPAPAVPAMKPKKPKTRPANVAPRPAAPSALREPATDISAPLERAQKAFKTAMALGNVKMFQRALREADAVLQAQPRHQEALLITGVSACKTGSAARAKKAHARLRKGHRARMETACNEAGIQLSKPKGPSESDRKQATSLAGQAGRALKTGMALEQPALFGKAGKLASKAASLDPGNIQARYVKAASGCLLGKKAAWRKLARGLPSALQSKLKALCAQ